MNSKNESRIQQLAERHGVTPSEAIDRIVAGYFARCEAERLEQWPSGVATEFVGLDPDELYRELVEIHREEIARRRMSKYLGALESGRRLGLLEDPKFLDAVEGLYPPRREPRSDLWVADDDDEAGELIPEPDDHGGDR